MAKKLGISITKNMKKLGVLQCIISNSKSFIWWDQYNLVEINPTDSYHPNHPSATELSKLNKNYETYKNSIRLTLDLS